MPGLGGGGGSAVTVWVLVGDVVAGAVGAVLAGVLVGLALVDGVALEEVGGALTFGSAVPGGVGVPPACGGVARGGGQGGSREPAASSRSCPMASSRVPAGSPA